MIRLEDAIQQKHFPDVHLKMDINIMFTASWLANIKSRALKDVGISWQQFNILRILKGCHPQAASVRYLAERMIDQTSNASRLVDKLVLKKLVDRKTCPEDRRQVEITLTPFGLKEIDHASLELEGAVKSYLHHLTEDEASQLNALLDKIRL